MRSCRRALVDRPLLAVACLLACRGSTHLGPGGRACIYNFCDLVNDHTRPYTRPAPARMGMRDVPPPDYQSQYKYPAHEQVPSKYVVHVHVSTCIGRSSERQGSPHHPVRWESRSEESTTSRATIDDPCPDPWTTTRASSQRRTCVARGTR